MSDALRPDAESRSRQLPRTVLQTEGLSKQFGEIRAVDDVSVDIRSGDITSIIGPNGAGKTTFYNLLTGALAPTAGSVRLVDGDGLVDITGKPMHEIARAGLSRSYQITNVFEGLTVRENVQVARISVDGRRLDFRSSIRTDEDVGDRTWEILELTNLTDLADVECSTLSHGEKRSVEIALTLAVDPSVVLLDEPTAGMNPTETDRIVDLVEHLDAQTATTFVLTEHDMDVVVGISDRILVLDDGSLIADGDPDAVMNDERVTEAYLGSETR
ncbi:ABC transporter ATP-binding protein [Haloferacaceae archaeon DSL9]